MTAVYPISAAYYCIKNEIQISFKNNYASTYPIYLSFYTGKNISGLHDNFVYNFNFI